MAGHHWPRETPHPHSFANRGRVRCLPWPMVAGHGEREKEGINEENVWRLEFWKKMKFWKFKILWLHEEGRENREKEKEKKLKLKGYFP